MFISYKKHEPSLNELKRSIITQNGAEIPITEIQTDNFSQVYDILNKITPGISPIRIRETRKLVKTIVDQSVSTHNAESVIVGIDDLANADLTSKPLAIAIGYKENILNKFGYGILSDDLIFEDILLDNKHFDANQMCMERFKSIASTRLLPVFKYVKNATVPWNTNDKLKSYVDSHDTTAKLFPPNIQKQVYSLPIISDYSALLFELDALNDINKKAGILLKNVTHYSLAEVRSICCSLFESNRDAAMHSTHFKRCVMYIDLLENFL